MAEVVTVITAVFNICMIVTVSIQLVARAVKGLFSTNETDDAN